LSFFFARFVVREQLSFDEYFADYRIFHVSIASVHNHVHSVVLFVQRSVQFSGTRIRFGF